MLECYCYQDLVQFTMIDRSTYPAQDRRGKPRISCSYPATLRGETPEGKKYETPAVLANMSAGGLYLRTKHQMQLGDILQVEVHMAVKQPPQTEAPRLSGLGSVVRVEPKADGTRGVALKLQKHRFP